MTNHITSWPLVLLRKTPLLPSLPTIADVSFTGMHIWGSGKFGLTLLVGVGLWCAIGWWRCRPK
ncbi:hypothetical protein [Nostoc foliaceum]|uniref:Uncharacterized protein n=1 Tax=Nostoc foliaceum FACHB-393 TaxID=2692915 RepID=A0ABR8IFP7_9NOSO|nr:hypothetical protein [Nostoc foliaceum]MBD2650009.1 hypothetical protein [Nostoc foliaceum FACHB-393]